MIDINSKLTNETIKEILVNNYIDRNKYLNGVINILNTVNESQIISLDGDWGSGKTWFVKSLEYLLNNDVDFDITGIDKEKLVKIKDEYMSFYYNAWENDDATSAMLSLIYKLVNDSSLEKEKSEVSALPRVLNAIIKYATEGLVDIKQDFFGEQWTNENITDCISTSEEIKSTFKELINNLLVENKNKILIIIDEIDRCKPTFAIDLLENIKHFYDDDRVVFLVVTNNKQLSASICKVYGEKYDGAAYLDKFFDINLSLPSNYIEKYINAIDNYEVQTEAKKILCREVAKEYKFTMREFNRYLKSIELIDDFLSNQSYLYYMWSFVSHILAPIALALKIKDKEKYYKFITGQLFNEIEFIINNNRFYEIGKSILSRVDNAIINDIYREQISDSEKRKKIRQEIIKCLKELYNQIFYNKVDAEYKENLNQLLDVISMMN